MSEHLPECSWAPHECDEDMCERCDRGCYCNELRACERRVRTVYAISHVRDEQPADGIAFGKGYATALDDARKAVAVLPEYRMRDTCIAAIDALREGER